jgi:hypothetical protein
MIAGQLALVLAAVFFGAAIYVDTPSYKRSFETVLLLALVGCVLGLVAWWQTGVRLWIVGALIMLANWPYTALAMDPITAAAAGASREGRRLNRPWAWRHAVRTALGFAATLVFLWASLR